MSRYAVINMSPANGRFSFSIWHETQLLAEEEAVRLCQNENKEFGVLKLLAVARRKVVPAEVIYEM